MLCTRRLFLPFFFFLITFLNFYQHNEKPIFSKGGEKKIKLTVSEVIKSYAADFGFYAKAQRVERSYYLGKIRKHSLPLITGDGFRMIADLIVDEHSINLSDTKSQFEWQSMSACELAGRYLNLSYGQAIVLFIKSSQVKQFFASGCFERMMYPVVLITHNGDEDQPFDNARYLEHPNLIHWFAQNCDRVHEKLTCIPIGIENRYWGPPSDTGSHGSMPELLFGMIVSYLQSHNVAELAILAQRNGRIQHTWAFFGKTHTSRDSLNSIIESSNPRWLRTSGSPDGGKYFVTDYYRNILQHVAIVCPRGNGRDSHRAWESLYLGRVIVTLHSSADILWDGLPVILLDSWDELPTAEIMILNAARTFATLDSLSANKLFMPHWICLIGTFANRISEFCGREAILRLLQS